LRHNSITQRSLAEHHHAWPSRAGLIERAELCHLGILFRVGQLIPGLQLTEPGEQHEVLHGDTSLSPPATVTGIAMTLSASRNRQQPEDQIGST
jgi:hypothetical protein